MQHPFINDLSGKSAEEILQTISDLNSKLNFAHRTQNRPLINQLQMVIESYSAENSRRLDEMYKKQNVQEQIKISTDNSK